MSLFPAMDEAIRFFVDHAPVPQPRQRHAIRKKRGGQDFIANYVPAKHPVHVFKKVVQLRARQAYNGEPLAGPLRVHVLFRMPRPLAMVWKTKPMPRAWMKGHVDVDNVLKALFDALNGLLWVDDSQVVDLHCMKMYAAGDEEAGVEVMVEELA